RVSLILLDECASRRHCAKPKKDIGTFLRMSKKEYFKQRPKVDFLPPILLWLECWVSSRRKSYSTPELTLRGITTSIPKGGNVSNDYLKNTEQCGISSIRHTGKMAVAFGCQTTFTPCETRMEQLSITKEQRRT